MTNMKKLLVGLFILGCAGMAAKAEAGQTFSTRSTGTIISSAAPFSVTWIALSSAATPVINAHYAVFYDTDGYASQGNPSMIGCTTNYALSQRITVPLFFASSITILSGGQIWAPQDRIVEFTGAGITVNNGLVICQEGGTNSTGGQVIVHTEPLGNNRNRPW